MKDLIRRRIAMFNGAIKFGEKITDRLKPHSRSLFAQLAATRDEMFRLGKDQSGGVEIYHNGTRRRATVALELRELLLDIARLARSLDRQEFPEAGKLICVTTSRGYYALRSQAVAFQKTLAGLEQAYIDREFPEDFIAQLQRTIERLDEATHAQMDGRTLRISGTAGLYAVSCLGMRIVMELDAILSMLLRRTDPALFAAWKSASHVERQPRRARADTKGREEAAEVDALQPTSQADTLVQAGLEGVETAVAAREPDSPPSSPSDLGPLFSFTPGAP